MQEWMPSLNALRAFECVARHLSYRAAADELRVTPGAVKQLVLKLEDAVGRKLVERKGQGLVLTPAGEAGRDGCSLAMQQLRDAVRSMRQQQSSHRVIVSVEASLATTWLSSRLDDFWRRHSDIDLLIDASQQIVDLENSEVDVAIRYGVPRDSDLWTTRLFKDLVFPACSPMLAAGPPRLETLEQLREVPLIHWNTAHMPWAHATKRWFSWSDWFRHIGLPQADTSGGREFSDYGLAVQAATAGQGVMLAGWPALQDTLDAGLLVCPFKDSIVETDIGFDLVTKHSSYQRPEVAAFTNWLIATANEVTPMRN